MLDAAANKDDYEEVFEVLYMHIWHFRIVGNYEPSLQHLANCDGGHGAVRTENSQSTLSVTYS